MSRLQRRDGPQISGTYHIRVTADYAHDLLTGRSVTRQIIVFAGSALIYWKSSRQTSKQTSTFSLEYTELNKNAITFAYHFVTEHQAAKIVEINDIKPEDNYADCLTKALYLQSPKSVPTNRPIRRLKDHVTSTSQKDDSEAHRVHNQPQFSPNWESGEHNNYEMLEIDVAMCAPHHKGLMCLSKISKYK